MIRSVEANGRCGQLVWLRTVVRRHKPNDGLTRGITMRILATYMSLAALLAVTALGAAAQSGSSNEDTERLAQITLLEDLHITFHSAVSVHDPVNGDSPAVITQRIRQVLSIWAEDGELTVLGNSASAGNYIGKGDPDDPETCPLPSGDTSATGKQGTLCTLYKYRAGGLQAANKWVSLTPAFKTKYVPVTDVNGQWRSSVYFECHYFDVSLNPATGLPLWTAKSHVNLSGEARKIDGRWLLTYATTTSVPVPVPGAISAVPVP